MKRLTVGGAVVTAFTAVALVASSLAGAAKVAPEFSAGAANKSCSNFQGAGQTWIELKVDPNANGTFSDGTLTVTITNTQNDKTFDWSSNIGVDAVFVKAGNDGSYLYRYDPPSEETSDSGLTSPGDSGNEISHISFCYDVDPKGSLTVIKNVVNDNGGTASASNWTMNVAGPTALSFAGAGAPGTTNQVNAGNYTITESGGPSGYALTYSGDCNAQGQVTVPANGSATCTLTNDDNELPPPPEKGTITVEKQTIPAGYVPPQGGFDFTGAIVAKLLDDQSETVEVEAGTYTVTEDLDGRPFWDLISITCDDGDSTGDLETKTATYEVAAGEDVTCVFTNQKRSLLIVEKETNPEGAGGDQEFAFETSYGDFSLAEGDENGAPLPAGSYSVVETVPDGWVLESASCDNGDDPRLGPIELPADTVVRCTFVNARVEPEPGTIVVEKETLPAGDEQEFPFEFGDTDFTLADGESRTFGDLDAGAYSVAEDTPEGWDLTSAACVSDLNQGPIAPGEIALATGETVTCTFVNTKRGSIIVEKQTSPAGADGFAFTGHAAGTIGDDEQIVVPNLVPGTYTSTESAAEGWLLTAIECDDEDSSGNVGTRTATFDVDPGENVRCTFTNVQQVVVQGQGAIDVQKSASSTSIKEPGGQVTYSVRITNTSSVGITVTNVVDDKFGDLDDSGGNGCFDVPINLAPGEFASCQFSGQVTGAAGTDHVNVVCADATDASGNPLKDCDDARVTITPRLIDLVVVKTATSPTPRNGTVNYSLTVTNKGPDTATNVQLADPAPAGITYLTANPSQGTCNVGAALVTCALGALAPGQTVTVAITARATAVGSHTNTATVTGSGGRETNPADNVDSAVTVVPAPLTPPTQRTPPAVDSDVCLSLTVTPKMIKADGKKDRVVAKVRAAAKPMKNVKVLIRGVGIRKSSKTNSKGIAVIVINPKKPGLITITTVGKGDSCGARRIGVVGVFLPPLTG
ncbi:MAG TPA: hypothetical protein VMK83_05695 [Gaiellaceae bacterium]|nr:hypothetical protein [Gaiellaceae bacterium]